MLCWKMQLLPYISSPSSQIWKIPSQKGMIILDKHFVYAQPYPILNNVVFAPDKSGSFFQDKDFEFAQPYVILKNAVVIPYLMSK